MDPCYFCQIIQRQTDPWNVIDDDGTTVILLNGRQFEVGQCIVLPRRHAPTLLDLSAQEASAVMAAARRLMQAMVSAFDPDGVLLYQNNGVGSGQEVPHFHLHVVPRRQGSDWGFGPPHLARLEGKAVPTKLDHTAITADKQRTVEELRRELLGSPR